jgi:hypothetical protein
MLNEISETPMFILGVLFVVCCSFLLWRFLGRIRSQSYRERSMRMHIRDLRLFNNHLKKQLEELKRETQTEEPIGMEPSDPPILPRMEPHLKDVIANGKGNEL